MVHITIVPKLRSNIHSTEWIIQKIIVKTTAVEAESGWLRTIAVRRMLVTRR